VRACEPLGACTRSAACVTNGTSPAALTPTAAPLADRCSAPLRAATTPSTQSTRAAAPEPRRSPPRDAPLRDSVGAARQALRRMRPTQAHGVCAPVMQLRVARHRRMLPQVRAAERGQLHVTQLGRAAQLRAVGSSDARVKCGT
jgi:hypothetical protein